MTRQSSRKLTPLAISTLCRAKERDVLLLEVPKRGESGYIITRQPKKTPVEDREGENTWSGRSSALKYDKEKIRRFGSKSAMYYIRHKGHNPESTGRQLDERF